MASTKYLKKIRDLAERNLKEGIAFLEENAKRDNVIVKPSGLQYEILKEGNGEIPTLKAKVLCHYKGTLLDGTVFDSSYKRKKPEAFFVRELIKGWQEVLVLMPIGSHWKIYIPCHLAYGFESLTENSGGNCTLIFEMELKAIL
ncbi:FKBP-type peptidyl-prolyl cis-trans isomerase [Sphingobacterium spiritivorum]|uniref:FKBP-type peptidyl-prolyl cis-trans isomerase n=1 Tax=Sphingobacterium spiritivorum TaxID=258 RepID=UPI0019191D04|nr:FKBP-type peptidyl-prolyl cis-trans isomerase [Sphingobacterium spiritivorum]QQT26139.1 FKBP-type peptidyl-prolyl cis-trans isomerase [Sphingobacterium spiritivorum]